MTLFYFYFRNIDVAIGGLAKSTIFSSDRSHDYSIVYDQDSITWCIKYKKIVPWKYYTFIAKDNEVIPLIIIFATVSGTIIYLFSAVENQNIDLITAQLKIYQYIYASTRISHTFYTHRFITGYALLAIIPALATVSAFYVLLIIYGKIYDHQIHTQNELIKNKYQLAGDENTFNILRNDGKVCNKCKCSRFNFLIISFIFQFPSGMLNQYKICQYIDDCLVQLIDDDRLAVAISQKHALNNRLVASWNLNCFNGREIIYSYPLAIFTQSDHPLRQKIEQLTQMAVEGGLLNKWTSDATNEFKQEKLNKHYSKSLSIQQFAFPFTALCCSCAISFVAFLIEHIVYKLARTNGKYQKYWKFLDKCLDGRRLFFDNLQIVKIKRQVKKRVTFAMDDNLSPHTC